MQQKDQDALEKPLQESPEFVDMEVGPGRDSDNRRFGSFLADLRDRSGLSRAAAATALGVSPEYLRLIELGRRTPALGQMRGLLDTYQVEGAVGRLQPGGDRPDLFVLDPRSGDPVIVEFSSRIREARGNRHVPSSETLKQEDGLASESLDPSANRATDLGHVVTLLARADARTIRKVQDLLQRELGRISDGET